MTKLVSVLLGVGMLLVAHALPAQALFESLQALPPLQNARVINSSQQEAVEKIYPLGSVRRISGRLRYTGEVLLHGQQSVLTVQLASTHTAGDAFMAARDYLEQHDAQMLFWCEGKDCGPSNLWANAVFDTARLYGPDEQQSYAAFIQPKDGSLITVYAITRGNGRSLLHFEQLAADSMPSDLRPTPATLLRQLREGGKLMLTHLPAEPEPQWLALLVRTLNQSAAFRVVIGGENAALWYEELIAAGVKANRVELDSAENSKLYLQLIQ
ncbi:DUF4892 domain-containing protein [Thiopseudomonas acetoxidans]|uniref:DUF4892 domain-containing protein n=1 Tax=Thiopseudomonas acetoxidans TaxID=3041622 RepID=A0ABT7SQ25_9GAMM|nr:DUF4892 domain-containing protein [Thiopseudomonas sp. CY1220]MDM7858109.1 DUF4892 domain-containing protein [Thiopseudomonas sp. CY1220]